MAFGGMYNKKNGVPPQSIWDPVFNLKTMAVATIQVTSIILKPVFVLYLIDLKQSFSPYP